MLAELFRQSLETDRCVDIASQERLARFQLPAQEDLNRILKQRVAKLWFAAGSVSNGFSEVSGQWHSG